MKWLLVQFSTVVVGQAHNPSILNPDFLAMQGIVPKSWGWDVAETVTTPPLAMVRYKNDVNITVEHNKIQITDPNVQDGPGKSKIPDIAAGYVKTLSHVRYIAVGNNFQGLIPMPDPGDFLRDRFLNEGPWSALPSNLDAVGLKLSYTIEPTCRLHLTIDAAESKLPDKADLQQVVVVNANFSRDCGEHPAADKAEEHLRQATNDWNMYKRALASILDIEV